MPPDSFFMLIGFAAVIFAIAVVIMAVGFLRNFKD